MQLTIRPYVTAGVVVVGAGLIHVTPVAVPEIGQRPVGLAAAEAFSDLAGSLDAVLSGMLPGLGDLDGALIDVPGLAATAAVDWWAQAWNDGQELWLAMVAVLGPLVIYAPVIIRDFLLGVPHDWEAFFAEISSYLALLVDPIETFFTDIYNGIAQLFQDAWEWLAGVLGLAPAEVAAMASDLPAAAAAALGEGAGLADVAPLFDAGLLDPGAFAGAMPDLDGLDGLDGLVTSLIP